MIQRACKVLLFTYYDDATVTKTDIIPLESGEERDSQRISIQGARC